MNNSTIHATALLIGEHALLIRGQAGSGKSSLALSLIREAQNSAGHCVRLIADDRVHLDRLPQALLARAPSRLAGLLEERGKGIINLPHDSCGVVRAVLDLDDNAPRLPTGEEQKTEIAGLQLPRFFHARRALLTLVAAIEIMEKANHSKEL
jgi:HPr kinase/phosphorylase